MEPEPLPEFQEAYTASILNDVFLKHVGKAGLSDLQADPGPLLRICDLFLSQHERDAAKLAEGPMAVVDGIVQVLKGFAALCSPTPGIHGSCLSDVQYLMPKNATTAPILALPRIGRILVNKLRQGEV